MDKSFVSETVDELIDNAERDMINVNVLLSKKFYPEDLMYNIICFHATQAAEKLLKGYIINNNKKIEKTHDLGYLHKAATEIDASFIKIKNDCVILNRFISNLKYSTRNQISEQNMALIIESLKNIYNLKQIKIIRDSFSKAHDYKIITEVTAN